MKEERKIERTTKQQGLMRTKKAEKKRKKEGEKIRKRVKNRKIK